MKPLLAFFAAGLLAASAQAAAVSPDGSCGGANGYTCAGSSQGTCCSQWGWCGSTSAYCGTGCNPAFGSCGGNDATSTKTTLSTTTTKTTTSTATSTRKVTPDGSCGGASGYTCAGGSFGTCCSQYGYCGSSSAYCGAGCNPAFGSCGSSSSSTTTTTSPSSTSTPVSVLQCLGAKNVPYLMSSSAGWGSAIDPYNQRLRYTPAAYVQPTTNQHVQDAVVCAGQAGLKVQAKSGGHSYASFSTGGRDGAVVISLEAFNGVALDGATGIAKVGGGVRLGNLADAIWTQGRRALPHGTCPGVGVGGHATHGGYGHTSRRWGLAMDTIVGLDVVLANGTLATASPGQNAELFWGLRGAADSLGVVTSFYLQTQAAPASITYWELRWGGGVVWGSKAAFTSTFLHLQDFATNASVVDDRISFGIYADGQGAFTPSGAFFGTVDEFNARIRPELVRGLPAPATFTVQAMSWIDYLVKVSGQATIVEPLTGYDAHDNFFAKSLTVPQSAGLTAAALGSLYDYVKTGTSVSYFFIVNLYGGPGSAINARTTDFAAYSDRDSLWVVQNYGETAASVGFINGLNSAVTAAQPQTAFGAYLNYVDPSLDAATAHKLYYGDAVYARLLALKRVVDPKAVFWHPQAIGA